MIRIVRVIGKTHLTQEYIMKNFDDAYNFLDSLPEIERDMMELIFTSDIQLIDDDFSKIVYRNMGIDKVKASYRKKRLLTKLKNFSKY